MIRHRHVYYVTGFDPITSGRHYRRFQREVAGFSTLWNVTTEMSGLTSSPEDRRAWWNVSTQAPNWRADTVYELMLWHDIVGQYMKRPTGSRLAKFLAAMVDLYRTGTLRRYFSISKPFGTPTILYCALAVLSFAAIGIAAGIWLAGFLEFSGLAYAATLLGTAAILFTVLLLRFVSRPINSQILEIWIFVIDYLHGRLPEVDARVDEFAAELVRRANAADCDEILIAGHSMGAIIALLVMQRALALDPAFARRGPAVCLLTVGSQIPRMSIHPAGERLRAGAERVANEPGIAWAEYHSRDDKMTFYALDPVSLVRIGDQTTRKPWLRLVQFKCMLTPWSLFRYRFFWAYRLHYQFVMANERRTAYDYYMMVCGPVPFEAMVKTHDGPEALFAPDGALNTEGVRVAGPERAAAAVGAS